MPGLTLGPQETRIHRIFLIAGLANFWVARAAGSSATDHNGYMQYYTAPMVPHLCGSLIHCMRFQSHMPVPPHCKRHLRHMPTLPSHVDAPAGLLPWSGQFLLQFLYCTRSPGPPELPGYRLHQPHKTQHSTLLPRAEAGSGTHTRKL